MTTLGQRLEAIEALEARLFAKDVLLTWEQTTAELRALMEIADMLKALYQEGRCLRVFESGLAVSQFRDNSTRTRFSFASASNLLGLAVQDLDEGKSQIAHGETVRETATMISFLTEAIGIRDDKFLGAGNAYMREVAAALDQGLEEGVLHQRPALVNLQCDIDHPTQTMADLLHLRNHFGSFEALRGKKIAMTWAYSPSYGKPLSVPQGVIGLMTKFGMEVRLAHPEGYHLMPECLEVARRNADDSGGDFAVAGSMAEAFEGADVVYPKSWAPYTVMQRRTELLRAQDHAGLDELEQECLAQNQRFQDWECTAEHMKGTRDGAALYMHCLPADITDVSCAAGEVAADVFERYRADTYREASYKPFIIAALILAGRFEDPAAVLRARAAGQPGDRHRTP